MLDVFRAFRGEGGIERDFLAAHAATGGSRITIVKLATESSLVTGIASALCYFLVVNWVVEYVQRSGG